MRQEKPDSDKKDENSYANEYMSIYGSNEPDNKTNQNNNLITHNNGNITHDTFDAIDTLNNPNVNIHDSNITPDILLEQLAYVDNFIPSLDQDFVSLDSWVMNESQNNSTNGNSNDNHNNNSSGSGHMNTATGNTFGLDEQLAVELSAFADEVFIFPDEDKPQNNNSNNNNSNNNNGSDDENKLDYDSSIKKDEHKNRNHLLSQRRNKFLSSQYDHSRSRFSSRRSHQEENNDDSNNNNNNNDTHNDEPITHITPSTINNVNTFHEDHSGFTNFEVDQSNQTGFEEEQQESHNNNSPPQPNQGNNTTYQRNHVPNVSSPLSNLVANNPTRTKTQQNNNYNNQATSNEPQIHLPDYSQIPTSTLVALLPRVKVPQGAHESLLRAGFAEDQITAIAAIIAYNEQRKNQPVNSNSNTNGQADQNSQRERSSSDKGAHFLLDLLTDKSKRKPTNNSSNTPNIERPISQPNLVPTPTSNSSSNDNSERRQKSNVSEPVLDTHISTSIPNIRQSTNRNSINNNVTSKSTSSIDDMRHLTEPIQQNHDTNTVETVKEKIDNNKKTIKPIIQKAAQLPISATTLVEVKKETQPNISYSQKKKLKGKELENSINELNDLALKLQQKIHTLEMENKLLKDLVVNSGEQEGLEQAESIKQNLLKRAHESTTQDNDESKENPKNGLNSDKNNDDEPNKKKRNSH